MTSTLKFGLIGLGIVGVGLGAYLVSTGLKGDKTAQKPVESTPLADRSGTGQMPAGTTAAEPAPGLPSPQGLGSTPVADTGSNTGHVGSPAPLGVRDVGDDIERSWRPQPLVTHEVPLAPPPAPITGPGETGPSAPSTPAAPTPGTTVFTPSAPAAHDGDRMTLREQPATRPAGAAGLTAAKPDAPAPAGSEKTTIHVVQAGDTLSSLAAKYLGSARHANLIEKANPKVKPNRLYVGTKLKIPAAPPATPAASPGTATPTATGAAKAKSAPPPVDPAKAYTVKAGDSWTSLAKQFLGDGNAWTAIYEYNRERFPGHSRALHPGMVIEIPPKDEAAPKK